ncbi:MAG: hypothetical protein DI538_23495 [Azospira oryzae]|jgi:hypothetical protein|nr:MAG: hypothetical protein DI538_23495 [Azospira oryzae]
MKKHIRFFLTVSVALILFSAKAQTSDLFDPKTSFTWLGIDFSQAKVIGERERIATDTQLKDMIAAWNELMIKEASKYNVKKAFHKEQVTTDFSPVISHNEALDLSAVLVDNPTDEGDFNTGVINDIIQSYDFGSLNGIGLMLNVERFSKPADKATIWFTFVNMDTKELLFTEQMTAPPAGRGVRNYWGSTVFLMLERIEKKEYPVWSKRKSTPVVIAPVATNKQIADNNPKVTTTKPTTPAPVSTRDATKKETKTTTTPATTSTENKSVKPGGQYFALLIGVSKYNDPRLNLDHPVSDARKMKETLGQFYDFEPGNILLLENPTRGEIFSALYKLRSRVTTNDNLLLFYAGHGFWDEKIKQGYWWPKDASTEDPSNWLSNSDLREQLRGINSAHTLLVSDACFSGGIFRTRDASAIKTASIDYQLLYKMPSRRAITSGTLTAVPDRSVFVEYLVKRLTQNQEQFLPAQQLFSSLRLAVINNSATVPQEGVIAEAGDEGGDFIFMRKKAAK